MKKVWVRLGNRSYPIIIGHKILGQTGAILRPLKIGKDAVIVTNPKIWFLYGGLLKKALLKQGFTASCETVPAKETSKSNKAAMRLIERISRKDKRRGTFIIAFGGGVVGDLAGFVASIYKRGIPYVQAPTTLLGQVDSAIGGKVAIDTAAAKNLVGAFYQPRLVLSDTSLLKSLPSREIASGLAEIIKYGVIIDKKLFAYLEKNIKKILRLDKNCLEFVIYRSSKIKAGIVGRDEEDTLSIRAVLNFGHTIGHAIEAAGKYSKTYTHGEAVAIGMAAASDIAKDMGILRESDKCRIKNLIKSAGLPVKVSRLKLKVIMDAQSRDKKIIHGVNRFVLPVSIGKTRIVENIPKELISKAIQCREVKK